MTQLRATYFGGDRSQGASVRLHKDAEDLIITFDDTGDETFCPLDAVAVEPPLAGIPRHLSLPDGSMIEVADDPLLEAWFHRASRLEAFTDWLERRWPVALASLGVTVGFVWALYTFALPAAATAMAYNMPLSWQRDIADGTEAILERLGVTESSIPMERQEAIRAAFAPMMDALPDTERYSLDFRSMPFFGPNAFALPGGRMVILDELINLTDDDDEILGVLAHELGHAYYRHPMRGAIQSSILGILATVTLGDASGLASIPLIGLQAAYSRDFEREADAFAIDAMRKAGISPDAFARIFEKLRDEVGVDGDEESWFATHPALNERIKAAKEAAAQD